MRFTAWIEVTNGYLLWRYSEREEKWKAVTTWKITARGHTSFMYHSGWMQTLLGSLEGKKTKRKNWRNLDPNFWSLSKTNKSEAAIAPASILCRLKGYTTYVARFTGVSRMIDGGLPSGSASKDLCRWDYSRFDLQGGGDALPFGFWVMTRIWAGDTK